jgi:MFS family permease
LDVPEARLGWINVSALLGMGLGTSLAAAFSDRIAEGNVVGTGVGLVAGTIATAFIDFDESDAEPDRGEGAELGRVVPGFSLLPEEDGSLTPMLTLSGDLTL